MGQIQICWSFIQQWTACEQFNGPAYNDLIFLVNIYEFLIEFFPNILLVCWWISVLLFICTKRISCMEIFVIWFGKAAHDPRIIFRIFLLPHPFITEKEKILSLGCSFFLHILHVRIFFCFFLPCLCKDIEQRLLKTILKMNT